MSAHPIRYLGSVSSSLGHRGLLNTHQEDFGAIQLADNPADSLGYCTNGKRHHWFPLSDDRHYTYLRCQGCGRRKKELKK